MICEDCADATDTNRRRERFDHPGHEVCQARTDAQRQALPFALSSCACQHRVTITSVPARATERLDWHYGPTSADPDSGKMWHYGCGQEVLYLEGGYICGCGAQGDEWGR